MRRESQPATAVAPPTQQEWVENLAHLSQRQLPMAALDSILIDPKLSMDISSTAAEGGAVTGLNHFNITASTALIEQVKQFYRDVLGLAVGPRAHLDHSGYWLYAGDSPILHLSACPDLEDSTVTCRGFFNHISLSCTGLQATIARLVATETPYRVSQLLDLGQTQLFITDPAGIGVELTFFE